MFVYFFFPSVLMWILVIVKPNGPNAFVLVLFATTMSTLAIAWSVFLYIEHLHGRDTADRYGCTDDKTYLKKLELQQGSNSKRK